MIGLSPSSRAAIVSLLFLLPVAVGAQLSGVHIETTTDLATIGVVSDYLYVAQTPTQDMLDRVKQNYPAAERSFWSLNPVDSKNAAFLLAGILKRRGLRIAGSQDELVGSRLVVPIVHRIGQFIYLTVSVAALHAGSSPEQLQMVPVWSAMTGAIPLERYVDRPEAFLELVFSYYGRRDVAATVSWPGP